MHDADKVRNRATVVVHEAVRGISRGRPPGSLDKRPRTRTIREERVPEQLMDAARRSLRPGQRIVVVSANEVRLENR